MVKTQGKVNKTKFAEKHGLAKSSLFTILDSKNRQVMDLAEMEGKTIEGRKRLKAKHCVQKKLTDMSKNVLKVTLFIAFDGTVGTGYIEYRLYRSIAYIEVSQIYKISHYVSQ